MTNRIQFCLAAAVLGLFCAAAQSRMVTDALHRHVTVPDEIHRVAVTNIYPLPSVLALYLNDTHPIVAVHPSSMAAARSGLLEQVFPMIAKADTGFIKGNDLNVESLLKLKPDVVLLNASDKASVSKLEAVGIPAVAFSTSSDNYDGIKTYSSWVKILDQLFPNHPKAHAVTAYADKILQLIRERTKDIAPEDRKKVLWIYQYSDKHIITSGRQFFGEYWADAVGAKNVSSSVPGKAANAQVNLEQIYAWKPDVIFITNFTPLMPKELEANPMWSSIPAVKNHEVFKLPLGFYRTYTPGPDSPVLLLWLAKKIYPNRFEDINLHEEAAKYYKEVFDVTLTEKQINQLFNPKPVKAATPVPGTR